MTTEFNPQQLRETADTIKNRESSETDSTEINVAQTVENLASAIENSELSPAQVRTLNREIGAALALIAEDIGDSRFENKAKLINEKIADFISTEGLDLNLVVGPVVALNSDIENSETKSEEGRDIPEVETDSTEAEESGAEVIDKARENLYETLGANKDGGKWERFKAGLIDGVMDAGEMVAKLIKDPIGTVKEMVSGLWEGVKSPIQTIKAIGQSVWDAMSNIYQTGVAASEVVIGLMIGGPVALARKVMRTTRSRAAETPNAENQNNPQEGETDSDPEDTDAESGQLDPEEGPLAPSGLADFEVGQPIRVTRSDGTVTNATVHSLRPDGLVEVRWQENGQHLQKVVRPDQLQLPEPNPNIRPQTINPNPPDTPIRTRTFERGQNVLVPRSDGSVTAATVDGHMPDGRVVVKWTENGQPMQKVVAPNRLSEPPANVIPMPVRPRLKRQKSQRSPEPGTPSRPKQNQERAPGLDLQQSFSEAHSLRELGLVFKRMNETNTTIEGSGGSYTGRQLYEMTKKVQNGELNINALPRTHGLRAQVNSIRDRQPASPEGRYSGNRNSVPDPNRSNVELRRQRLIQDLWPNGLDSHMNQGRIGDCYFVAALRNIKAHPQAQKILADIVTPEANGSYTVRFPGDAHNRPINITSAQVNEMRNIGLRGSLGNRILERAYARLIKQNKAGETDGRYSGDTVMDMPGQKMDIEGGQANIAMRDMLGSVFKTRNIPQNQIVETLEGINSRNQHRVVAALSSRRLDRGVNGRMDSHKYEGRDIDGNQLTLYHGHAYSVEKFDFNNRKLLISNPHDTQGQRFWMSYEQVQEYFGVLRAGEVNLSQYDQNQRAA
jgi:hypothetical protein